MPRQSLSFADGRTSLLIIHSTIGCLWVTLLQCRGREAESKFSFRSTSGHEVGGSGEGGGGGRGGGEEGDGLDC